MAVCEVSSYQAESLKHFHPQSLIWTNFDEDHLDRYDSLKEYFNAKWRLVEQLSRPSMVVGESVAYYAEKFGKTLPPFAKIVRRDDANTAPPPGTPFESFPQQENYRLVRTFWEKETMSVSMLEQTAKQFALPRHRLQLVGELGGASFWNDSKATNFASALAALKGFDRPIFWIGGGKSKSGDVSRFADTVAKNVDQTFLIGETAPALAERFRAANVTTHLCKNLPEAVQMAFDRVHMPTVVLLSPGFSSLDMFESYTQRGFAFEQAVLSLKKRQTTDNPDTCSKTGETSS